MRYLSLPQNVYFWPVHSSLAVYTIGGESRIVSSGTVQVTGSGNWNLGSDHMHAGGTLRLLLGINTYVAFSGVCVAGEIVVHRVRALVVRNASFAILRECSVLSNGTVSVVLNANMNLQGTIVAQSGWLLVENSASLGPTPCRNCERGCGSPSEYGHG